MPGLAGGGLVPVPPEGLAPEPLPPGYIVVTRAHIAGPRTGAAPGELLRATLTGQVGDREATVGERTVEDLLAAKGTQPLTPGDVAAEPGDDPEAAALLADVRADRDQSLSDSGPPAGWDDEAP